jgi:outer membrane murein-binding lipoprotein Lpp
MKKIILLFAVVVILATGVFAELEIDEIKFYINNEREPSADKEGGDIDIQRGDLMEISIDVDNNEANTTEVRYIGTIFDIDDGEDDKKTLGYFDIDAYDDKTRTLSFNIPSDAELSYYSLEIEIDYRYLNGTEGKYDIDYDLRVINDEEEIDLRSSFDNLTNTCNSLLNSFGNFAYYINESENAKDELTTCREEMGDYKSQAEECQSTIEGVKEERDECTGTTVPDLNRQIESLQNKVDTMITSKECEKITEEKVKEKVDEAKGESQQFLFFALAIGIGIWWWQNNKKGNLSTEKKYYYKRQL